MWCWSLQKNFVINIFIFVPFFSKVCNVEVSGIKPTDGCEEFQ